MKLVLQFMSNIDYNRLYLLFRVMGILYILMYYIDVHLLMVNKYREIHQYAKFP